tara:strand:- start:805 stop:1785 length:981 start_codon:yes stop_codon:yes gene_type:complete
MKINKLIYNIKKYYNSYNIDDINIDNIYNKSLINNYISITNSTNFSNFPEVQINLEKCKYITLIYLNYLNINLYVYSCNKLNNIEISKLLKLYRRISFIYKYYNINKTINIHLSFWLKSKIIPYKNQLFEPIHINGGFTNINGNDIYVFRKDEYSKVILHELMHHINKLNTLLFNIKSSNILILKNFFNIDNKCIIEPTEAIIEFWATIYNLIFISIEYSIPFKLLLKKELSFTLFQYKKIITKYKHINKWNEKTNIFSYIIIKLILLLNYNKFLKLNIPYEEHLFINFIMKYYNPDYYLKLENNNNNNFDFKSKNSMDFMLFSNF